METPYDNSLSELTNAQKINIKKNIITISHYTKKTLENRRIVSQVEERSIRLPKRQMSRFFIILYNFGTAFILFALRPHK